MFRFPPLTPLVRALLIVLATLFVVEAVLENFVGVPVFELFALNPRALGLPTLWQVFTHVLVMPPVQGAVFPFMLSLAFIWLILAPFEERYGRERVVQLSLVAAVLAAVPAVIIGQVAPSMATLVAGPQTLTLAAICAYAVLLPAHSEVSFFGLFPMRPKHLVGVVIAFSVLGFLTSRNAAQLAADLGAIAGGVGFSKLWMQRPPKRRAFGRGRKGSGSSAKLRLVRDDDDDEPKRWLN